MVGFQHFHIMTMKQTWFHVLSWIWSPFYLGWKSVCWIWTTWFLGKTTTSSKKPMTLYEREQQYIQHQIQQFQCCCDLIHDKANESIELTWYHLQANYEEEHKKLYEQVDAEMEMIIPVTPWIETSWKTRQLVTWTPRGNIFMVYDMYREGFAYYADHSYIPYAILNAVAMKYVQIFYCRDFFVDELVLSSMDRVHPSNNPMIQRIKHQEEKEKQTKKQQLQQHLSKETQFMYADVFVTKDNKQQDMKHVKSTQEDKDLVKEDTKDAIRNKFIYMGKISNQFQVLQRSSKQSTTMEMKSKSTKGKMSWKEYIESLQLSSMEKTPVSSIHQELFQEDEEHDSDDPRMSFRTMMSLCAH